MVISGKFLALNYVLDTMPVKKAAIKDLRQNKKRRARNLQVTNQIKKLVKEARAHLTKGNKEKAAEAVKKAVKALDKAVQNKKMKKNTASRTKSRLMKALNKVKS